MTSTCAERLFAILGNAVIFFSAYQFAKRKAKVQSSDDHADKANPVSSVGQPAFWHRLLFKTSELFLLLLIGMILCGLVGRWFLLFQSSDTGHDGTVGIFDILLIHGAWAGGLLLCYKVSINIWPGSCFSHVDPARGWPDRSWSLSFISISVSKRIRTADSSTGPSGFSLPFTPY
ncbi:hypothetical protein HD553DRAFT_188489 [Filobasidium floriforme]|uniref:uncharacterized protein n=1 Tax=Filobasidium floriforme TaxID=5210 RepID=UPI001E8D99F3|nr:uncharacterized protein HD553DRAFT_188489 [Filobasidium floriforme]KAH8088094.1 hypothetical protein HD553DRAFT_188489 [Filobasidium floriforme]